MGGWWVGDIAIILTSSRVQVGFWELILTVDLERELDLDPSLSISAYWLPVSLCLTAAIGRFYNMLKNIKSSTDLSDPTVFMARVEDWAHLWTRDHQHPPCWPRAWRWTVPRTYHGTREQRGKKIWNKIWFSQLWHNLQDVIVTIVLLFGLLQ